MFPVCKNITWLLFILSLTLASCDSRRVFEENKALADGKWKAKEKISFRVTIPDTTIAYNVYLNVRNVLDYPYSNLYLFMETKFPDGRKSRDTLECMLADYDGRWLGSGIGSMKFNQFLLQKGVFFSQKGIYLFEVEQAMRVNELKGIHDIGLRIEK